jgi:hypothetical protein
VLLLLLLPGGGSHRGRLLLRHPRVHAGRGGKGPVHLRVPGGQVRGPGGGGELWGFSSIMVCLCCNAAQHEPVNWMLW